MVMLSEVKQVELQANLLREYLMIKMAKKLWNLKE
jgi:hypothetical protein